MTMTPAFTGYGLPDPESQPEFYRGVAVKRGIAWLIDISIITLLALLALPFTLFSGVFFFPLLMLLIGFFYRWLTIAGGSATFGMRLMAIELRGADGERLGSGQAFLHTAGYLFSVVTAPLQLVSALLMLATPRAQGLTDHVMGTTALNRAI